MLQKRGGFTLLEVLAAVVVLVLTATAALRLVMLAQNSLERSRRREEFLKQTISLQIAIRGGAVSSSGESGDIRWEVTEHERGTLGENFGKLDFDKDGTSEDLFNEIKWKDLTVESSDGLKNVLIVPYNTGLTVSGDWEGKDGKEREIGKKKSDHR